MNAAAFCQFFTTVILQDKDKVVPIRFPRMFKPDGAI